MNFQDFICGLVAGWSQIIVGQPFDYIKVKVQVQQSSIKKSLIDVTKQIYKQHGILGFYRGASSLFFGFSFTVGTQFAIYEFSKRFIYDLRTRNQIDKKPYNDSSLKISDIGIAGMIVGLSVSVIYCPIQYVKIKRQLHYDVNGSSLQLLFKEIKNYGIRNITKGLSATVFRQVLGTYLYYAAYQKSVRTLSRQDRQNANTLIYALSGSIGGASYWLVAYPFDVVKTKVQNGENYKNAMKDILKVCYRGFSTVLVRSIFVYAASFTAYEHSKQLCQFLKNKKGIH